MTTEELIRAVRLKFIENDREDPVYEFAHRGSVFVREYAAVKRRSRAHRRVLFTSSSFYQLATGFLKARVIDPADELVSLVTWLAVIDSLTKGDGPQQLAKRIAEQARTRAEIVATLRSAAAPLTEKYADRIHKLADEIEDDILAIHGYEIGGHIINVDNIGRRGAAATLADGAWRGLFIRELRDRLPALEHFKPDEFAMLAHLLSWAGIGGVNSTLVRSVIGRGHT